MHAYIHTFRDSNIDTYVQTDRQTRTGIHKVVLYIHIHIQTDRQTYMYTHSTHKYRDKCIDRERQTDM